MKIYMVCPILQDENKLTMQSSHENIHCHTSIISIINYSSMIQTTCNRELDNIVGTDIAEALFEMTSLELYQDLRHKTSRVVLEWHHLVLTSRWSVQLFWHNSSRWWRHRRTLGHGIYLHYITLLAKDSDVTGKPLQLGRTYHRRRTLRKTKTAGKATGNHPDKYVIRETVSMQLYHSAV